MGRAGLLLGLLAAAGLVALLAWATFHVPPEGPLPSRTSRPAPVPRPRRPPLAVPPGPRAPAPAPGPAASARRGPALLTGVILGRGGRPLAGALVYLAPPDASFVLVPDLPALARTDGEGRFLLRAAPGPADLLAWAAGYLPRLTSGLRLAPGEHRDLGALALDPGLPVSGTVVDEKGRPVAGAEVTAYRGEKAPSPAVLPARAGVPAWGGVAVTDEAGRYTVSGLSPEPVLLAVRGLGILMAGDPVEAVPGASGVTLVVKRLRLATGRVTAGEGGPAVGGATVRLEIRGPRGGVALLSRTLPDGRFAFDLSEDRYASPALRFDVLVSAEGFEDASLTGLLLGDLLPEAELRIPLVRAVPEEPGRLRGRVTYEEGEPFRGTLTLSFGREGQAGRVFRAATDEDGNFLLEGIPPGEYVLRTAPRSSRVLRETGKRLVIPPGGEETVELTFERGGDLEIRIEDAEGKAPREAAAVLLDGEGKETGTFPAVGGVVRLTDLVPGPVRVRVTAPGHLPETVEAETEKGRLTRVEVRLREKR